MCPLCRAPVAWRNDGYVCENCARVFPVYDGIPDFRVHPDPYLSTPEDLERSRKIVAALASHDFESLLEYYWSEAHVTAPSLNAKFIRSVLLGDAKAKRTLGLLEGGAFGVAVAPRRVLEVGSGTGSFLARASADSRTVVGADISMRWLHVSRRRFMDLGLPVPPLACCCAEYLPFPDDTFDLVASSATLEFLRDPERAFGDARRVLAVEGALYLNTVNRYALTQDAYVYLAGVGFLPRALQAAYVRMRGRGSYENIRLLSYGELDAIAKPYFSDRRYLLPDIDDASLRAFSPLTRLQVRIYRRLLGRPVTRALLLRLGPGWDCLFRAGPRDTESKPGQAPARIGKRPGTT